MLRMILQIVTLFIMPLLGRKERIDHLRKIYIRHGLYHSDYLCIIQGGSDYQRWAQKAKIQELRLFDAIQQGYSKV